jgi:hypothetical protein
MLCPESWYTDRRSQYVAIQPFLPFLSVDEEHEIIGILGFPGHPWSRGKVEVTLREFNKAIKKFAGSGFIRNEKDKNEIKRARKEAKLKLEQLETAIETHVDSWNHGAQEGHKSRYEQWQDASRVGHPAPPLESLMYLAGAEQWDVASVSDQGISINGTNYKPREVKKQEDYDRWLDATGRGQVRYCIIPLTKGELVVASIDEETWEEVIPVDQELTARRSHVKKQWGSIREKHGRLKQMRDFFQQRMEEMHGGMVARSLTEDPILPDDRVRPESDTEEEEKDHTEPQEQPQSAASTDAPQPQSSGPDPSPKTATDGDKQDNGDEEIDLNALQEQRHPKRKRG